jgi:hypothetical protein
MLNDGLKEPSYYDSTWFGTSTGSNSVGVFPCEFLCCLSMNNKRSNIKSIYLWCGVESGVNSSSYPKQIEFYKYLLEGKPPKPTSSNTKDNSNFQLFGTMNNDRVTTVDTPVILNL